MRTPDTYLPRRTKGLRPESQSLDFVVTLTMRSWNSIVGFLTDWDGLRMASMMGRDDGNPWTAARTAKVFAALGSRMSSCCQGTQRSELCPLGHRRDHRGSYLAGIQRFEE